MEVPIQETFKPGQIAPESGQYLTIYIRKGVATVGGEVTVVRGEKFPPTKKKGGVYLLVDATLHAK